MNTRISLLVIIIITFTVSCSIPIKVDTNVYQQKYNYEESRAKQFYKSYFISDKYTVEIENVFGDITIIGLENSNNALIEGEMSVYSGTGVTATEELAKMELDIEQVWAEEILKIKAINPGMADKFICNTDMRIELPIGVELRVYNRYGDVEIINNNNFCKAVNDKGTLTVDNLYKSELKLTDGDIIAQNLRGEFNIFAVKSNGLVIVDIKKFEPHSNNIIAVNSGNLNLSFPPSANVDLQAEYPGGELYKYNLNFSTEFDTGTKFIGTMGSATAKLDVKVKNGNLELSGH